jgi:hypothetical protein
LALALAEAAVVAGWLQAEVQDLVQILRLETAGAVDAGQSFVTCMLQMLVQSLLALALAELAERQMLQQRRLLRPPYTISTQLLLATAALQPLAHTSASQEGAGLVPLEEHLGGASLLARLPQVFMTTRNWLAALVSQTAQAALAVLLRQRQRSAS